MYGKRYFVPFITIALFSFLSFSSAIHGAEAVTDATVGHELAFTCAPIVNAQLAPTIQFRHVSTDTIETVLLPIVARNGFSSQAEWTADWWQWIEAQNNGPLNDEGQTDCGLGQSGEVWFLAGTGGGAAVTRSCPVPTDTTFMIPLFTVAWDNEGNENLTVAEKRVVLDELFSDTEPGVLNSKICQLTSTVDGVPYTHLRLTSPTFLRRADPEAVADGYWFAIRPQLGEHEIHFTGALCNFDTGTPTIEVDVTYKLTVEAVNPDPTEPWRLFVWNTNSNQVATGCEPADPAGVVPCDAVSLGRNSTYAEAPPWAFTTVSENATLTVVDTDSSGDVFEVFDNDVLLGGTSDSQGNGHCNVPPGGDPGLCLRRPDMSTGIFSLDVGSHAITIKPVEGFYAGVGYFRFDDPSD